MQKFNMLLRTSRFIVNKKFSRTVKFGTQFAFYSSNKEPTVNSNVHVEHRENEDLINIKIPDYKFPLSEGITQKRARLTWQSRKRGIAENCLLLSTFADKYLSSFNEEELNLYDVILNVPSNDWELYYWITGLKDLPDEYNNLVMQKIITHCKNERKETRFEQPSLKYDPVTS